MKIQVWIKRSEGFAPCTSSSRFHCLRGCIWNSLHLKVVKCFTAECQLLECDGPPVTQIKGGEPWLTASLQQPLKDWGIKSPDFLLNEKREKKVIFSFPRKWPKCCRQSLSHATRCYVTWCVHLNSLSANKKRK